MPDRRTFLRLLASAALSQTFDWDKALWVPGARSWFLGPHKPSYSPLTFNPGAFSMVWPMPKRLQAFVVQNATHYDMLLGWSNVTLKSGDTFTIEGVYR